MTSEGERVTSGPAVNPDGFVEFWVWVAGHELRIAVAPTWGLGVTDAPSLNEDNLARAFGSRVLKAERILFHRLISTLRQTGCAPPEAIVRDNPKVCNRGHLHLRLELGGRACYSTVSSTLSSVDAGWQDGSIEMEEDDWASIYDGCLSYVDGHANKLEASGFDVSELRRQQAVATCGYPTE
jgi:hypothetical protein